MVRLSLRCHNVKRRSPVIGVLLPLSCAVIGSMGKSNLSLVRLFFSLLEEEILDGDWVVWDNKCV